MSTTIETIDSPVFAFDAIQDVRDVLSGMHEALIYKRAMPDKNDFDYMLMCVIDQMLDKLIAVDRWLESDLDDSDTDA